MKEYVYRTTIKETYGLPERWIEEYLGEPDKLVPNPHWRSGPPSKLYLRARVEALIESRQDEYRALQEQRARRSAAAHAAVAVRIQALLAFAEEAEIRIDPLPPYRVLAREAEMAFLLFRAERNDFAAEFTRSRNAVIAHVRHNYTNYHELLAEIEGRPGVQQAYAIIKDRVNAAVEVRLREQQMRGG